MVGSARSEAKRLRSMLPWDQKGYLSLPQPRLRSSLNAMLSIPELHLRGLSEPPPSLDQDPSEMFSRETISKVKGKDSAIR